MCGWIAWFMLGAINETAPLAFSLVPHNDLGASTEQGVMALAASLALGTVIAVLAGGYLADSFGRLAVIRPSLLATIGAGMLVQVSTTLQQAIVARFLLGLSSGALFGVMPPLIAELLPSRHRGFYLTIWCSGWPVGALTSVLVAHLMPEHGARVLYTMMLVPAMTLYVCTRADMLPESPRYLYLVGRRDEGYMTLMDMYEKQSLPLPWAPETIAVQTAPTRDTQGHKLGMSSSTGVIFCLALAMFAVSAAAQSMKLWMPTMLVAQQADAASTVAPGLVEMRPSLLALFLGPGTGQRSFASGPMATSFLSVVHAPLMLREPNFIATMVLMQGYLMEFVGIIACAYLSMWVSRKRMVQWSLLAATVFTLGALAVAQSGFLLLCGPLVGFQLAAQAAGFNFLQVFASEHFPTSSRATTTALVVFVAQLGTFTVPVLGGFAVHKVGAGGAVMFFSGLYMLGWLFSLRLPLPVGRERALHDVEEPAPSKKMDGPSRKKEWMSYHATQ
jgi:MFS family permease